MLAIRMQRTGRRGHAQFRVIVQDDRFSPKSGRIVAYVGSYDPHTKVAQLDTEKITGYLGNGAQPSDRVAKILKKEGLKLPAWVSIKPDKKRAIRHPQKLRRNLPPGESPQASVADTDKTESDTPAPEPVSGETKDNTQTEQPAKEEVAKEPVSEPTDSDTPAEKPTQAPAEAKPAEAGSEPAAEEKSEPLGEPKNS